MQPLAGYRLLDLTHMVAGPSAGMMLADLGMETIKIEPPERGDTTRRIGDKAAYFKGFSPYYMTYNRNKKSVTLNLKHEAGQVAFHRLVKASDAVLYNFSGGVVQRLGLDHATLSAVNPRIVTASITGFGETGPLADVTAYDMVAQAMGGNMAITGEAGKPLRSGIPIGDVGAGYLAVVGILAALLARQTTGKGQHVDASLLDSQVSMLGYVLTTALQTGIMPPRMGNAHPVHVPYDAYPTADGWIVLAVVPDPFWRGVVEVVGLPELDTEENRTQPGRAKNRAAITAALTEALQEETSAYWVERLRAARVPCAPVLNVDEIATHPQVRARRMVVEVEHPAGGTFMTVGNPVKLSEAGEQPLTPPPTLGQHTAAVLREVAGYDADEIAALRAAGAV